jgi:hypothetical protein
VLLPSTGHSSAARAERSVTWEPITLSEEQIRAFVASAAAFEQHLQAQQQRLWRTIIDRAGGNERAESGMSSEPAGAQSLLSVWQPGTTIAPLYSGDMPPEGGGTTD